MSAAALPVIVALTAVAIVGIVAGAALAAWRGWLALKRAQLRGGAAEPDAGEPEPAVLIELASVKERLRRLEAIASGVEL